MSVSLLQRRPGADRAWLPGELRALSGPSLDEVRRIAAHALNTRARPPLEATLRVAGYEQICGHIADAERRLRRALSRTRSATVRAELLGQLAVGRVMGSPSAQLPPRPPGPLSDTATIRWIVAERFDELLRDGDGKERSWSRHLAEVTEAVRRFRRTARDNGSGQIAELGLHVTMLAACSGFADLALTAARVWGDAVRRSGAQAWLPLVDFVTADAARAAGDFDRANELLDRSLPGLWLIPTGPWCRWAEAQVVLARSYTFDAAPVADSVPAITRFGVAESEIEAAKAHLALPLARALLLASDPASADLALALAGPPETVLASLGSLDKLRYLEIDGLAAAAHGDHEKLDRAISQAERLMASPLRQLVLSRLRYASASPGEHARRAREDALRIAREQGMDLEELHSRLFLLLTSLSNGDRNAALRDLAELDPHVVGTGARGVRSRAVAAVGGVDPRGGFTRLTPREQDVAVLIARGLSNREIAARLYLAERSVEGYVTRVLRAIGATRRVQLAAIANLEEPDPDDHRAALGALTVRQAQTAVLVATGATNSEIARALGITEGVAERHVQAATRRLHVGSRTALARVVASALRDR